jgi:hypothetical protein
MGRYIEQTESRSELQQRIAADLRAKAAANAKDDGGEPGGGHKSPDGVDDAAYLKGTKSTTTLAPVWLVLFIAGIAVFVYFIYQVNR